MRLKLWLLSLIYFCISQANAQVAPSELPSLSFPAQCRVADSLRTHVRQNYYKTEVFNPYIRAARDANDDELVALLHILRVIPRDISGSDTRDIITDIIYKSKKNGWKEIEAIAYRILASFYRHTLNDHEKRFKYSQMSYQLYKDWDEAYFIFKPRYLFDLGAVYRYFNDYDNAILFYRKAYTLSDSAVNLNTIGLTFLSAQQPDSALRYFDLEYELAERRDQTQYLDVIAGNRVSVYLQKKEYDKALTLALEIYKRIEKRPKGAPLKGNFLTTIGRIYFKKGELRLAEQSFSEALFFFRKTGDDWQDNLMKSAQRVYEGMSETQAALGNYRAAYLYADTMRTVERALAQKTSISKVKNIEKDITKTQLISTEENLKYERKSTIQSRNNLIVIVVSSSIIIILLVYIFTGRQKKLRAEKNKASSEAEGLKEQMNTFTRNIQEKNKLLESLEKKISTYELKEEAADYSDTITELRNATILTDADWIAFKNVFEKAHNGYLSRLKENYPSLTQAEQRYIVLSKLDMDTKEMASVLGVNASSVRVIKSRIIKKLSLEDDNELVDLINSI